MASFLQDDHSASQRLIAIVLIATLLIILRSVVLAIHQLYFGPLSGIPGPKLSSLTSWYERYFDLYLGGQMTLHIHHDLHKKYGTLVFPILTCSACSLVFITYSLKVQLFELAETKSISTMQITMKPSTPTRNLSQNTNHIRYGSVHQPLEQQQFLTTFIDSAGLHSIPTSQHKLWHDLHQKFNLECLCYAIGSTGIIRVILTSQWYYKSAQAVTQQM